MGRCPVAHGAPIRLRVERELGYKHTKHIAHRALLESFEKIAGGNGGLGDDQGYAWYADI